MFPSPNTRDQTTEGFHRQLIRLFLSSRSYSPAVEMTHQVALTMASQLLNCSHADAAQRLLRCMSGMTWAQNRPGEKVRLGGYGVELALKSTEYKAMDDIKVDEVGDTSGNLTDSPIDPVVQGFNFTALNELHPDLKEQLGAFQKHLFATDDEIRPLKVWQFRELGLQTTQAIMNAFRLGDSHSGINAGLETLRDVSQYLPARAGRLVSLQVDPALREELSTNQYTLSNLGIQPGQTVLSINGLLISPSIDIFALLDLLRQESHLMLKLLRLGIPASRIMPLLCASATGEQSSGGNANDLAVPGSKYSLSGKFALDLSGAPISYFNNLELDLAYSNWPHSLHTLFTPDFSGGIRRLRRNLYNVILVVDPASEDSRQMIRLVESFLIHQTPIRFGVLWAVDSTGISSASLALVRTFTYIASTVSSARDSPLPLNVPNLGSPGTMSALSFLTELYSKAERLNQKLTVSFVRRTFERLFPSAHSEDVFEEEFGIGDYDSQLKQNYTNTCLFNFLMFLVFGRLLSTSPNKNKVDMYLSFYRMLSQVIHSCLGGIPYVLDYSCTYICLFSRTTLTCAAVLVLVGLIDNVLERRTFIKSKDW
ncbi:UDP-glucose:glycoprotein glucosyltransferase [Fasciolopsis buskii]|uniref:UDP-glucose:glycoprotein glucosyltransferase n=1 Tax=Fasciolopsis buskii TaxID=27845 RepID=A0A8E0VEU1_9TREM|nr:UDP-glucose:glycoprotein glucosyltransferase [Fasciolopsis buski]